MALLFSIQETKGNIEAAQNGFMFEPQSHPLDIPDFEISMRDIDSSLREILAVHQQIQQAYRLLMHDENREFTRTGSGHPQSSFRIDENLQGAKGDVKI